MLKSLSPNAKMLIKVAAVRIALPVAVIVTAHVVAKKIENKMEANA